ncbi:MULTISPECIES: hypothetical protein [unclassified Aurantimonas]|uniref:hypothetical protein n=1 Tax=unclassified Aurantimonas TaxID=2638230 RepID=UPI002E16E01D|nr:hypothetical protein [Aurantimonas sp. A3-2-R12]
MGRLHAVGQVSAPFCLEGTSASLSDRPALQFAMVSDPITALPLTDFHDAIAAIAEHGRVILLIDACRSALTES